MPRNPETFGQGARSHQKCPRPCLAPEFRVVAGKSWGNRWGKGALNPWMSFWSDTHGKSFSRILKIKMNINPWRLQHLSEKQNPVRPCFDMSRIHCTTQAESLIPRAFEELQNWHVNSLGDSTFCLWENPQITIKTMVKSTSNYHVWITIYQWNQELMK